MNEQSSTNKSELRKCIIIVYSYHHNNTMKIANELSKVIDATIVTRDTVSRDEHK